MNIRMLLEERGLIFPEKVGKTFMTRDPEYSSVTLYQLNGKVLDMLHAVSMLADKFRWRDQTRTAVFKRLFEILGNDNPNGEIIIEQKTGNLRGWVSCNDAFQNVEIWLLLAKDIDYKKIKPLLENLGET